ncbi:MAG: aminotransferase class III-fold pyridoxal phosphate-dependent enzyme, partial [Chitinophagaceae bacterium]
SSHAKVFYSDNGSTAVEVALKMAIQFWNNQGTPKTKIIAFKNAYHGDTFGAMSVSGRSIFTRVFENFLFEVVFIDLPNPKNIEGIITFLTGIIQDCAAFIFEPLLLGSVGLMMYPSESLDQLIEFCQKMGIITIADEVLTGFGRTGKNFACEYLQHQPDISCFSKGLTGGTMALGVTTCNKKVYNAFYSADKTKTLFHGHSFTANPIACASALASLDLFLKEDCQLNIQRISHSHLGFSQKLTGNNKIKNIRQLGTVVAFDVITSYDDSYINPIRDLMYKFFIDRKIIIRPLGNTIYLMPPYCISDEQLQSAYTVIEDFLASI